MNANGGVEVAVAVYSDYTCPWCYIGTVRLDRLESDLPEGVELDVEWKPFEIHPEVPAEGMPVEELGYPPDRWEAMTRELERQAREEGLEMGNRPKVSNTHRALVASAWAQAEEPEGFEDFHRILFRTYFADGRDLGDPEVLADAAREAGLDVERMNEALEGGEYEEALERTAAEARRLGITGTPTYVFGGRYAAVGAQPVEGLRRAMEAALEDAG